MLKLTKWYSVAVFLVAGLATVTFAFASVNLFTSAMASYDFIAEFRGEAIRHGALWQVLELVLSGSIALSAWLTFKVCEHVLVERYLTWSRTTNKRLDLRMEKEG